MNLISFYREHLVAQVLTLLLIVMILFIGSILIFNMKGQNIVFGDLLDQQYDMFFTSIEDTMNNSLAIGDNESVREQFRKLKKKMPDIDVLIFDSNQKISMAGSSDMEGLSLTSLVKNKVAIDAVKTMIKSGKAPVISFRERDGNMESHSSFHPILKDPACLNCHESSSDVMGGVMIRASIEKASNILRSNNNRNIIIGILGLGLVLILFYLFFQQVVNQPIHQLLEATGKLRRGDFTHNVTVRGKNEISHICARMNIVSKSLRDMMEEALTATEELTASSNDLSKMSINLSSGAKQTSDMSDSVAASSEGMNLNIKMASDMIERTSSNVRAVASSAEEMTTTINRIAQNSEKAREIANKAVSKAEGASGEVDELGKAAREINKITETITKISEQTNLLALNATIEAARAGEAGKGFAVVANEVKNLARQTAEATDNIEKQIVGIQRSTEHTVSQIKEISTVINDVNEIVTSIAIAVDEQSGTTGEIAESVAQTSEGIQDVNEMVGQVSIIADDFIGSISKVNGAARDMSNSSVHVQMSAEALLMLTEQLKKALGRFKV